MQDGFIFSDTIERNIITSGLHPFIAPWPADQLIVLQNGQIVEIGTHKTLLEFKHHYYNLVKNQLELAS
jgi:hypothetical protein